MSELIELIQTSGLAAHLIGGVLVLARLAPVVALAPFFGGPALSAAVRAVVTLALLLAVYPSACPEPLPWPGAGELLLLSLKELVLGLALGLLTAVAFHTLTMAGQLVDRSRGVPGAGPLALLYLQLGVVTFLVIGGHRMFIAALAASYDAVPLASLPLAPEGARELALLSARLVAGAIATALMLAAPAVAALLVTDVALGMIGRASPRLGGWFWSMPLRAAIGLTLALLSLSLVLRAMAPALGELGELLRRGAEVFGGGR